MSILDFIPSYPEITNSQLQRELFQKKELNELKLDVISEMPEPGEYFDYQTMLARILNMPTGYDRMLLQLETGVGKTCSFILTHELIKKYKEEKFIPTLFLAKSDTLIQNAKSEYLKKCPGGFDDLDINEQRAILRKNFKFNTIESFFNTISKLRDADIIKRYSNRLIVVDEAQDLRAPKTYKQALRFFSLIENSKVIFLSATPIVDEVSEMIELLNLLTDEKERRKPSDFITSKGLKNTNELGKYMRGKLAYIRQSGIAADKVFHEQNVPQDMFEELKIYGCKMSEFQYEAYKKAVQKEIDQEKEAKEKREKAKKKAEAEGKEAPKGGAGTAKHLMTIRKDASMFVFPDGSFGKEGFDKYIVKKNKKEYKFKSNDIKKDIKENLEKYSIKYYEAIQMILNNPERCFFIFSDMVHNGGLILFGLVLELFKFTKAKGTATTTGKRYLPLFGSEITGARIDKLIKDFSSEKNVLGEYYQVVLGSERVARGITIGNLTHTLIMTPQWNWSTLQQIFGRGVRPGANKHLIEAGIDDTMNIYLMAAIHGDVKTSDLKMYLDVEKKKIPTDEMIAFAKRASIICPLAYKRNVLKKEENYKCLEMKPSGKDEKGIYEYDVVAKDIDPTNYNILYSEEDVSAIFNFVYDQMRERGQMFVNEIKYDDVLVYVSITKFIDEKVEFMNKYGERSFLKRYNDILYLQPILTQENDPNRVFFFNDRYYPMDTNLRELLEKRYLERINPKQIQEFFDTFEDLFPPIQAFLFELCYSSPQRKKCLKKMEGAYYEVDGNVYHFLYSKRDTGTSYSVDVIKVEITGVARKYDTQLKRFVYISGEEEKKVREKIQKMKKGKPQKDISGFVGKDEKFRIRIIKPQKYIQIKRPKGMVCRSFSDDEKLDILVELNKFPPLKGKEKQLSREVLLDILNAPDKIKNDKIRKELKSFTDDQLRGIWTAIKMSSDDLCDFLKKILT